MNILLSSRLTVYKGVVSAFIQQSWAIRNWIIPLLGVEALARLGILFLGSPVAIAFASQ